MIYPVYIYGSAALRAESVAIGKDYPELDQIVANMFETMYDSNGVGLAAPQVGKNIRLFVVDASPMAEVLEEPELLNTKKVFINPEIYEVSEEEELDGEGCLSIPGISEDVSRPVCIKVRYCDEDFTQHDETICGYFARVVQHEYDHLDGVMFVDRLSSLRKTLIKGKLSSMSKGKFKASYRTVQKK